MEKSRKYSAYSLKTGLGRWLKLVRFLPHKHEDLRWTHVETMYGREGLLCGGNRDGWLSGAYWPARPA